MCLTSSALLSRIVFSVLDARNCSLPTIQDQNNAGHELFVSIVMM